MVRWYDLKGFSCPVSGCPGQSGSYDWVCSSCQTPMFIAETGYIKCQKGTHNEKIIKWKFNCGNHGNHPVNSFKFADFQGFTLALSHALQLSSKAGAIWVSSLVLELGEQYGKLESS